MDNQFTYKGRPVFIDSKCAYYLDDNNNKVYITLIGGTTRIKKVIVPTPPVLNGVFTLSANGSVGTIQSGSGLIIPTNFSTGYPGNLKVKLTLSGGTVPIGSIVGTGFAWGTVVDLIAPNIVIVDTIGGATGWNTGNPYFTFNTATGQIGGGASITVNNFILTIPTSQPITNINLTATSGAATSVGTCSNTLFQGFVSSGGNSFPTQPPVFNGSCIGVGIGLNGWKASVTNLNTSTSNSANNYELTFTKFGIGIPISTSWTINS